MNMGAATRMKLVLTDQEICPNVPLKGMKEKNSLRENARTLSVVAT